MVNSRRRAEVIDNARHHDANNPYKEIDVNEPRFKSHVGGNHERFQQGEYYNEENAGEHMCNQLSHTLKNNSNQKRFM